MNNLQTRKIRRLVEKFRIAIDELCEEGAFDKEIPFCSFPRGCCGDTCYLLAEYLRVKGIDTIYVNGVDYDQSHAWLVVKDDSIKNPIQKSETLPNYMISIYNRYSNDINDGTINIIRYEEDDLKDGLIIDITGDQFGEIPIFVDYMDGFHRKYEFRAAHDLEYLEDDRLYRIYRMIVKRIS